MSISICTKRCSSKFATHSKPNNISDDRLLKFRYYYDIVFFKMYNYTFTFSSSL